MFKRISVLGVAVAAAAVFSGCPEWTQPPFDATGTYKGTFALGAGNTQIAQDCGITVTLVHNINAGAIENAKVSGTVKMNVSCVAGNTNGIFDGVLGQLFSTGAINVSGAILPDGTLELNTDGLLNDCPTNTCERLVLLGKGTDTNNDGKMDTYDGTFGGLVQISGQLVPLVGQFTTDFSASN